MSKIISISNHKGGVGKTSSTANLGAALVNQGKQVLIIDLDPQANLSQHFGISHEQEYNIYNAMTGKKINPIEILDGLDIIPSTLDLSGAEIELSTEPGSQFILKEIIDQMRERYDYILIDCPPSLGLLTINAFTASDEIIIPLQAEFFAIQGVAKMIEVIEKVKKRLNKNLHIRGVVITQFDSRRILNREVLESAEDYFGDKVFKTKIRDNIALAEAPSNGLDIFRYNPKSYGAEDYLNLSKEILMNK